jgi:hypothetical protein
MKFWWTVDPLARAPGLVSPSTMTRSISAMLSTRERLMPSSQPRSRRTVSMPWLDLRSLAPIPAICEPTAPPRTAPSGPAPSAPREAPTMVSRAGEVEAGAMAFRVRSAVSCSAYGMGRSVLRARSEAPWIWNGLPWMMSPRWLAASLSVCAEPTPSIWPIAAPEARFWLR